MFAAQLGMGESWRIGVSDDDKLTSSPAAGSRSAATRSTPTMIVWPDRLRVDGAYLARVRGDRGDRVRVGDPGACPVEEPYLLRTHGDEYRRYASRVGRFVPGVGRLP